MITIFDIQRCSMVDGPGLRTTVFFKGCNLRCAWCHNPESQLKEKQLMFFRNRCTGCGTCARICPNHLQSCDLCGKCADYCPQGAREMVGKDMSAEEIYHIVEKDKAYYESSGGGVTFSGGECMLQYEELAELMKLCKEGGIQTAVDTAGSVPWEYFERVDPYTDLYLYDIKSFDPENHKKYTGVRNELLLSNLEKLAERNVDKIIIRIPVIPGVNTSDEEMQGMSDIVKRLGIKKVELLPFHKMGEHKYKAIQREVFECEAPTKEEMEKYRKFFRE